MIHKYIDLSLFTLRLKTTMKLSINQSWISYLRLVRPLTPIIDRATWAFLTFDM